MLRSVFSARPPVPVFVRALDSPGMELQWAVALRRGILLAGASVVGTTVALALLPVLRKRLAVQLTTMRKAVLELTFSLRRTFPHVNFFHVVQKHRDDPPEDFGRNVVSEALDGRRSFDITLRYGATRILETLVSCTSNVAVLLALTWVSRGLVGASTASQLDMALSPAFADATGLLLQVCRPTGIGATTSGRPGDRLLDLSAISLLTQAHVFLTHVKPRVLSARVVSVLLPTLAIPEMHAAGAAGRNCAKRVLTTCTWRDLMAWQIASEVVSLSALGAVLAVDWLVTEVRRRRGHVAPRTVQRGVIFARRLGLAARAVVAVSICAIVLPGIVRALRPASKSTDAGGSELRYWCSCVGLIFASS
jgi:hypothetical protein